MLTGIFIALSFVTLLGYATVAVRTKSLPSPPALAKWFNRVVGSVFASFGAALAALRRPDA
jgi:threonine/homoserine/homoserine lactone efflux protein